MATKEDITLWDRKTLCPIKTINLSTLSSPFSEVLRVSLSFPVGGSLLAIACEDGIKYIKRDGVGYGRTRSTRDVQSNFNIQGLTLFPDGSHVFAKIEEDGFRLFDVFTGNAIPQTGRDDLN